MPFDSPDMNLGDLLTQVDHGKVQLPDFQREWKWDDERIASLLATVTLGYPMGGVMTLETGGSEVNFAPRALDGVALKAEVLPEQLLLDGQQRLTSLYQALKSQRPVATMDTRGKKLHRWYLIDIERALEDDGDREESIISAPADLKVMENFGRTVKADYSSQAAQCRSGVFPLWIAFDMPKVFAWQAGYVADDPARVGLWNDFYQRVLHNVAGYTVPVIVLKKSTPKEAVCTVFEKVNTGGVPLNVFELLTATFAADSTNPDFRLAEDWRARQARLRAKPVLRSVESTDLLQIIALLATSARRQRHLDEGRDPAQAPGVSCKRRDILRLTLDDYLRYAPDAEAALMWAAGFLGQQHVFRAEDLPYSTQLVPLAAIRATLGAGADSHGVHEKLRRWYWCGVLGELYGGTTETRFARDLEQTVPWARGQGPEPATVAQAGFQDGRLLTLRTRNSAAYKGIYALLMREGCMDWMFHQPMNMATFLDLAVDIHHIFPKKWCADHGIDRARQESIVNKTALSATTNRKIGGRSPADYLKIVESESGLGGAALDEILRSHVIDPEALRAADFAAFFEDRRSRLLAMIVEAMGKPSIDGDDDSTPIYVEEEDDAIDVEAGTGASVEIGQEEEFDDRTATSSMASEPEVDVDLEKLFDKAMVNVYQAAKNEAGYTAHQFIQMVSNRGGLATARSLLNAPAVSSGFTALWERNRLDLSVEAVVVQARFKPLFSDEDVETAYLRLAEYGYTPPSSV